MRELVALVVLLSLPFAIGPASAQGIEAEGNVQTSGQLISEVATGTPPLTVKSNTAVRNLNADYLDGKHAVSFAEVAELLAAMDSLDNPDPPCFNNTTRFVDCGNGTVTDTVTGVIWLEQADCFPEMTYAAANGVALALYDGSTADPLGGDCGLSDGSRPGDWRLPTNEEWEGILDPSCSGDTPDIEILGNGTVDLGCYNDNPWATGVQANSYWSATSGSKLGTPSSAWSARVDLGAIVEEVVRTNDFYSWPVRGGPSSDRYTSRRMLYESESSVDIPAGFSGAASASCEAASDLPISGSCDSISTSALLLKSFVAQDWTLLLTAASWECTFFNDHPSGAVQTGTAKIICARAP